MEVETGNLYHIKDEFFEKINKSGLMINHKDNGLRPTYLAIKDKDILWFIPLSSRINKYQKIKDIKDKKYGSCKTILIEKIAGRKQAILIQNAFPTLKKYIKSYHLINGKKVRISSSVKYEIKDAFNYVKSLKEEGINLFFTDVDKIKEIMESELPKLETV